MSEYDIDFDDVKKFYEKFLGKNHIYQIFYKKGGASQQKKIKNLQKLKTFLTKNRLKGLQCVSINPRNKGLTGVESVDSIRNLVFDIDVKPDFKEEGVSPKNVKEEAKQLAYKVKDKLVEKGFEPGCLVDSGNGFHLYIPVDIPLFFSSKEEWKDSLVYRKLKGLEKGLKGLETDKVEVDYISKDITRRMKIPGTWNVKEGMDENRYRRCEIVEIWGFDRDENSDCFKGLNPFEEEDNQVEEHVETTGEDKDLVDIIGEIRSFDDKFDELFRGSVSGYPSRSEGEQALACKCIFYGLDPFETLDMSGMTKWSEKGEDYKKMTVNKARSFVADRFDWDSYWRGKEGLEQDIPDFDGDNGGIEYFDFDEDGVRDDVGFEDVVEMFEDNNISKHRALNTAVQRILQKYKFLTFYDTNVLWYFSNPVYDDKGEFIVENELSDRFENYLKNSDYNEAIESVKRVSKDLRENVEEGDNIVAFKNGWFDLESLEMISPDPDLFVSAEIDVVYDEEADCPRFKDYLMDRIPSHDDRVLLQEFLGTALVSKKLHKKGCVIVGKTDSGKSTLLNVIRDVFGRDNVSNQSPVVISESRWGKAKLFNKLLNVDDELSGGELENLYILKKVLDGNYITAERKNEQTFEYKPYCEHLFAGNQTPTAKRTDDAFWNRWIVLEMPESLDEEDKVLGYDELLLEERQGILNWIIEGWKRFKENGYRFSVRRDWEFERDRWLNWGDSIQRFISNCLYFEEGNKISSQELYDYYTEWAEKYSTMHIKGKRKFTKAIRQLTYSNFSKNLRIDGKKRRGFKNIGVEVEGIDKLAQSLKEGKTFDLSMVYHKKEKVKEFIRLKDDGEGVSIVEFYDFFKDDEVVADVLEELVEIGDVMEVKPGKYRMV